ncbi:beta-galactosidase [Aquipluma nitroreducens]|uniref:beta-galactosidase n=1 Tax=Aquipluma nitroreducens TaxID=2010828 RepID=A0A5K7S411_9BACT|nr:glycoside hydrolase family 2 TIM barrel-domain containing protein [Aquipluma nitroreducens]BBE16084.1 beta-galactosidase [Aquipluma nitroreducens]
MRLKTRYTKPSGILISLCLLAGTASGKTESFQDRVAASLTPRPINVNTLKELKIDLNGTWKFNPAPQAGFQTVKKVPANWSNIAVPGEWTMQGFSVKSNTRAAYMKSFAIPSEWKDCDIKLRCDAVFSDAVISINGKNAGMHQGGLNAFEMDVTNLIKQGTENIISMGIMSESLADSLMSGSQYAAHQLGGILRKVYLIAVPKVHISSLHLATNWESKSDVAMLTADYEIENQSGKEIAKSNIQFELFNSLGGKIEMIEVKENSANGTESHRKVFNVSKPKKWDSEHPYLYTLKITYSANNQSEQIKQLIGFRKIEVIGNQLFVNEKPVKLRGVNHHDVHPLLGRALNQELWEKDVRLYRAANINYIRTSHYPPSEEFVQLCDELGMYVEVENPIAWVGQGANSKWEKEDPHQAKFLPLIEQITQQTVEYLRNHPSVIIWSMANESSWGPNWKANFEFLKTLDSSRPSTFHDQAYGENNSHGSTDMPIANIHYPGPAGPEVAANFPRPLLFGEYCHLNTYNRQEIVTDPGVRDAWGIGLEPMWNNMYYSRGCLGGAIWSGIDDVFYLPEGKAVGYGEWGPIDGWRREKPEYYHIKKSYSPVKVYTSEIKFPISGNEIQIQAENRFDFSNFKELKIEWTLGNESGKLTADILPRTYGVIRISPGHQIIDGESLALKFTSPLGFVIDEYRIPVGHHEHETISLVQEDEPLMITKTKDEVVIKGKTFAWSFNATNGTIRQATKNGKEIMQEGTALMMLPLSTGPCLTEYSLDIQPLNNTCANWKMSGLITEESEKQIVVKVNGSYNEATGTISYTIDSKGNLQIGYEFTSAIDINPRQWGLVFTVPRNVEKLSWNRKGQWNIYPENHIGRTKGEASPYHVTQSRNLKFGTEPTWDWRYDSNELGSNDFRSSKDFIYEASLESKEGYGIRVNGQGKQTFRSFVNGESIQFLVAGFSTGGGDSFFSSHLEKYRKPLKKGDSFSGTVLLQLFAN